MEDATTTATPAGGATPDDATAKSNIIVIPLTGDNDKMYLFFECDQAVSVGEQTGVLGEVVYLAPCDTFKVERSGENGSEYQRRFSMELMGPEGRPFTADAYVAHQDEIYGLIASLFKPVAAATPGEDGGGSGEAAPVISEGE